MPKPYVIIGVPLVAAPTDEEASYLASSVFQRVLGILRGARGKLPAPVEGFVERLGPQERAGIADFMACAVVGGPETVRAGFESLAEQTECDEMMLVCDVYDPHCVCARWISRWPCGTANRCRVQPLPLPHEWPDLARCCEPLARPRRLLRGRCGGGRSDFGGGAVVSTGVTLTGKAVGAGIDAMSSKPEQADNSGIIVRERISPASAPCRPAVGDSMNETPCT